MKAALLNETRLRSLLRRGMTMLLPEWEQGSTNTTARALFCELKQGPVLVATTWQTGGRGTRGRSFFGSRDGGLYLSLALKPPCAGELLGLVTPAVAVAVACAVREECSVEVGIKWVNDIIAGGKKLCGILCETGFDSTGQPEVLTIGVGVNLKAQALSEELGAIATALDVFCDTVDVDRLCAGIVNRVFEQLGTLEQKSFLDTYRSLSVLLGRRIRYEAGDTVFEGTATDIDDEACLVVTLDSGECRILNCGDVSVRLV